MHRIFRLGPDRGRDPFAKRGLDAPRGEAPLRADHKRAIVRAMSHPTKPDRPFLGIVLMLAFCVVIPFSDALAKILGTSIPLLQLIEVRFLAQAALFLPLTLWLGVTLYPTARAFRLTLWRTLLQIAGLGFMFTALRYLPLADAVAIAFVMPFIILLMGHVLLGEEVGPRRIAACIVGFCGTLLVLQPSFAAVGWPALLPLGVAVIFAVFTLITRVLAAEMSPLAMQSASALIAIPLLLPLAFLEVPGDPPPLSWVWPQNAQLWLLPVFGATGAIGHLLITASLRFAPAATLAPMQYLEIPVAAALGWLLFQELPNAMASFGITITILAGVYIIWRERAASCSP